MKIAINAFSHTPSQVGYLKPDETLPGGNTPIYLSNLIIRLDDQGKLKKDELYGIDGSIVKLSLIKSRNNKAGQEVYLVFDQNKGFDRELSLLELLKQHKKLKGGGRWQYVGDLDEVKFSQREFKEKLRTEPRLVEEVHKQCLEILESYIYDSRKEKEKLKEIEDSVNDDIVTVTDLLLVNVA